MPYCRPDEPHVLFATFSDLRPHVFGAASFFFGSAAYRPILPSNFLVSPSISSVSGVRSAVSLPGLGHRANDSSIVIESRL